MSINIGGNYTGTQHAVFGHIINAQPSSAPAAAPTMNITNPLTAAHPAGCNNFSVEQYAFEKLQTCTDKDDMVWVMKNNHWYPTHPIVPKIPDVPAVPKQEDTTTTSAPADDHHSSWRDDAFIKKHMDNLRTMRDAKSGNELKAWFEKQDAKTQKLEQKEEIIKKALETSLKQ